MLPASRPGADADGGADLASQHVVAPALLRGHLDPVLLRCRAGGHFQLSHQLHDRGGPAHSRRVASRKQTKDWIGFKTRVHARRHQGPAVACGQIEAKAGPRVGLLEQPVVRRNRPRPGRLQGFRRGSQTAAVRLGSRPEQDREAGSRRDRGRRTSFSTIRSVSAEST